MTKLFLSVIIGTLTAFPLFSRDIGSDSVPQGKPNLQGEFSVLPENRSKAESLAHFANAYLLLLEKKKFSELVDNEILKSIELNPKARYPVSILTANWYTGSDYKKWAESLVPIAEKNPEAIELTLDACTALMMLKRNEDAEKLLEKSRKYLDDLPVQEKLDNGYERVAIYLLNVFSKEKKYSEGEDVYGDAAGIPEIADSFEFRRASAVFFSQAVEAEDKGFFSGWRKSRMNRELAVNLAETERLWCRKIKRDFENNKRTNVGDISSIVEIFQHEKNTEKSEELIMNLLLFSPDNVAALTFLAKIYSDLGWHRMARRVWENIVEKSTMEPYFLYMLGNEYRLNEQYEKALESFEKCLKYNPNLDSAVFQLGLTLFNMHEYDKCIERMSKVQDLPEAEYIKAICSYRKKDYEKALDYLLKAEKTAKNLEDNNFLGRDFYMMLASYCEKCKKTDDAIKILRKILQSSSSDDEASNFLGYLLADGNMSLDEAHGLIKKALEIKPENVAYLDSMAWVLYRLGKYAEAKEYVQKAIAGDSPAPDAVIADHAGDIYLALGDKAKAVEFWKMALETESEDLDRQKVMDKINSIK